MRGELRRNVVVNGRQAEYLNVQSLTRRTQALEALVLGVHLLNVKRILVIPHTRCAMTANSERDLRQQISESAGVSADWQMFSVVTDQLRALEDDIQAIRAHPLIPDSIRVGGFMYDVDTGLLEQPF